MTANLTRRRFLTMLALGVTAAGCSPMIDRHYRPAPPEDLTQPRGFDRDPVVHLLNRATYGARPGDVARVRQMGAAAWLDAQFYPDDIDTTEVDWRLRRFDTLDMLPRDLLSVGGRLPDKRFVANELAVATLIRAVFSERQLFEVMVGFWTDHFSIYHFKKTVPNLKTVDDREVIRPHALGNFGDMLRASAQSPAMLVYLDNVLNEKSHPNENYAREIMELHTLGVDGGYTEQDVVEVARCFTGWTVNERWEFFYNDEWHDDGEKVVLGEMIRSDDGISDGQRVLDILLAHPSTPRFVCTKLARRLVADAPPAELVEDMVQAWDATDGDIVPVLRTVFDHPQFADAPPKLKRPFELVASLLRVTNANYNGDFALLDKLEDMGHRPFNYPTPDGYPDTAEGWSGNLLGRWNLGIDALNNALPGVRVNVDELVKAAGGDPDNPASLGFLARLLLKRDMTQEEAERVQEFVDALPEPGFLDDQSQTTRMMGAILASPGFQYR